MFLTSAPGQTNRSRRPYNGGMPTSKDLKNKAARYRALARQSGDDEAAHAIFGLAAELEQQARDMDQRK
jgi:hypothetical protein